MWTALHLHSLDDFLLSALKCSSFFALSFSDTRGKVTLQARWHLQVDFTVLLRPEAESARKYLKVLRKSTLRWADRFQKLTVKGSLSMRNIVWTQPLTANQRVRRFCAAIPQNRYKFHSDLWWWNSESAPYYQITLVPQWFLSDRLAVAVTWNVIHRIFINMF